MRLDRDGEAAPHGNAGVRPDVDVVREVDVTRWAMTRRRSGRASVLSWSSVPRRRRRPDQRLELVVPPADGRRASGQLVATGVGDAVDRARALARRLLRGGRQAVGDQPLGLVVQLSLGARPEPAEARCTCGELVRRPVTEPSRPSRETTIVVGDRGMPTGHRALGSSTLS